MIYIYVTTGYRCNDVSIACAAAMLGFQQQLPRVAEAHGGAHLCFADNLAGIEVPPDASAVCVIDGSVGFDAPALLRALERPDVLTVHVLPKPELHWANLTAPELAGEPAASRVMEYTVTLDAAAAAAAGKPSLAPVKAATFEVFAVPKRFLKGARRVLDACKAALDAGAVVADLDATSTRTGPAEYAGRVGDRRALR